MKKILFIENCMCPEWVLVETSATAEMLEEFVNTYEDGAANFDLLGEYKIIKASDTLPASEVLDGIPEEQAEEIIYIDIE